MMPNVSVVGQQLGRLIALRSLYLQEGWPLVALMLLPAIFLHFSARHSGRQCSPTASVLVNFVSLLAWTPPLGYVYVRRSWWCLGAFVSAWALWGAFLTYVAGALQLSSNVHFAMFLALLLLVSLPAALFAFRLNRLSPDAANRFAPWRAWPRVLAGDNWRLGWRYTVRTYPLFILAMLTISAVGIPGPGVSAITAGFAVYAACLGLLMWGASTAVKTIGSPDSNSLHVALGIFARTCLVSWFLTSMITLGLAAPYAYRWWARFNEHLADSREVTTSAIPPPFLDFTSLDEVTSSRMLPAGSRLRLVGPVRLAGRKEQIWHYRAQAEDNPRSSGSPR